MAQGDLAAALKSFRDSLAIMERLAQSDPSNAGWQRDLSVSYDKVGDVQEAQGDLEAALKSYRDGLAIKRTLAQSDPGNAAWQRDLSVSYKKVGDVQLALGDFAAAMKSAIRQSHHHRAPGAIRSPQRRLAARSVSVVRQGRRRAGGAGRSCGALISFSDSLAISERLAQSDPGNAGWQRDLSVSYTKIGDVQRAQRDLAAALKSYRDSLAIIERLVKSDPGNTGWQRDLTVSYGKLASAYIRSTDLENALAALRKGRAIIDRLVKLSQTNAIWKSDLDWFDSQIAALTKEPTPTGNGGGN